MASLYPRSTRQVHSFLRCLQRTWLAFNFLNAITTILFLGSQHLGAAWYLFCWQTKAEPRFILGRSSTLAIVLTICFAILNGAPIGARHGALAVVSSCNLFLVWQLPRKFLASHFTPTWFWFCCRAVGMSRLGQTGLRSQFSDGQHLGPSHRLWWAAHRHAQRSYLHNVRQFHSEGHSQSGQAPVMRLTFTNRVLSHHCPPEQHDF